MLYQEWYKTLEDGRTVKFTWIVKFTSHELQEGGAFITAQLAGNPKVYSVVLPNASIPLSREFVESHFEGELANK